MKILTIEKPIKGWGADYSSSNSSGIEAGANQYSKATAVSLYRPGLLGHIAPGETLTKLTDSGGLVTALPLNGVVDKTGQRFVVLRNAKVVRYSTGDASDASTTPTLDGTHSGHTSIATSDNQDILIIEVAGTEYILSSWEDATDGDIMLVGTDLSTSKDSDWFTTMGDVSALTVGVPHRMLAGMVDNDVYVTNGQYISTITITGAPTVDGNVTASLQALNLGNGWVATSLARYQNFVAITAVKKGSLSNTTRGESRMYLWDGFNPDPNYIYDIGDNFVSAILNDGGVLKVFTQGINNTTKIKQFTGQGFSTLFESAQIGSAPRHGSVDVYENKPTFGNNGSERIMVLDGSAFHYRILATNSGNSDATITDIGMVKNLSSNLLYIGFTEGSNFGVAKINFSGYQPAAQFRSAVYSLPYKSTIKKVTIYFSQFGTNAAITFSLFKDYNAVSIGGGADLINQSLTNSSLGAVTAYSFNKVIPDVSAFYFVIDWTHSNTTDTAAIIRKVEILYDEGSDKY